MSRGRRFWLAAASTCALVAAITAAASADSRQSPLSKIIHADCGNGPITLVANSNGFWHSSQVLDSTAVFIPLAFNESGVFTDPSGIEHPFSADESKGSASPNGQTVVTCSFSVDQPFFGGRLVSAGTLTGFFTP